MNSNSQPTPGPWIAAGHCPQDLPHRLIADCGDNQAVVTQQSGNIVLREHAQANARLIAAAPALLAACKELRAYADLKLQGHRQDYPENHCMVQTALRMIAIADSAIALAQEGK